tara:strand:+ start:5189 stop:5974 length:786 start_codon:yes stop_codon:yes gene_type:complete
MRYKIPLLQSGADRVEKWTTFDELIYNTVQPGDVYRWRVVEKENPNGQYPFKNIEAMLDKIAEADMGPGQPSTVGTTAQPPPSPRQGDGSEVTAWADHPTKRRSIERQQALAYAIKWLPVPEFGEGVHEEAENQLLNLAERFYAFISDEKPLQPSGDTTEKPQDPRTATEQAQADAVADPDASDPSLLFGPDFNLGQYLTEHGELTKDKLKSFLVEQMGDPADIADGKAAKAMEWVQTSGKNLRQAAELMLAQRTGDTKDF